MALLGGFRRKRRLERSAERFQCAVAGRLELCDSGVVFEGRLINLSIGGAMFRPALAYLLLRKSGDVVLQVGGMAIAGEIMGTSPQGYGLRFDQALSNEAMRQLLGAGQPVEIAA